MRKGLLRLRPAYALAIVVILSTAGLVAYSSIGPTASASLNISALAGDPNEVLTLAIAAAQDLGSARLSTDGSLAGISGQHSARGDFIDVSGRSVIDAGWRAGTQTIDSSSNGHAKFRFLSNGAYYQRDSTFMQGDDFPASESSAYAGKWVSYPVASGGFIELAERVTLELAVTGVLPSEPYTLTKVSKFGGNAVVGVSGGLSTATAWPSDVTGSEVLYVSTVSPYVPVLSVAHLSQNGRLQTRTTVFSHWGESVATTAPTHSLPASSIPQPSP